MKPELLQKPGFSGAKESGGHEVSSREAQTKEYKERYSYVALYDFKFFAPGFSHSFVNLRIFESSASSLSAIGKAWTGNVPWTILELLGCVEVVERRMMATAYYVLRAGSVA
jgi:hypothetical protein